MPIHTESRPSSTPAVLRLVVLAAAAVIAFSAAALPAFGQEYTVDEGALQNTSGEALLPGETIVVTGGGFLPGAKVRITIESDPILLAVVTADARGIISARVTVPSGMPVGSHTLKATGAAPDGGLAVLRQPVTVAQGATTDATDPTDATGTSDTAGGVAAAGSRALAATGAPLPLAVLVAAVLLASGIVLVARKSRA